MKSEISPEEIKGIRGKYKLSQQSFARLLGIGEASMARYEKGQAPTRANANLIRAAERPEFMRDCLKRDGSLISEAQRSNAERIVYSMITFNEEGGIDTMTDIYLITLEQEILNEHVANVLADLDRRIQKAQEDGDSKLATILEIIATDIAILKPTITTIENASKPNLAVLSGKIKALESVAYSIMAKAA